MRVIAGKWRSRRLARPSDKTTRPMPDRAREAIFSMLGSHFDTPGTLPPIRVADLFAGSGSMGIEALSRGAEHCTFFEQDHQVLEVLRRNLSELNTGSDAAVVRGNAWNALARSIALATIDLIILDPPYADTADTSEQGQLCRLLSALADQRETRPLVVVHHRASISLNLELLAPWQVVDNRKFGTSGIVILS